VKARAKATAARVAEESGGVAKLVPVAVVGEKEPARKSVGTEGVGPRFAAGHEGRVGGSCRRRRWSQEGLRRVEMRRTGWRGRRRGAGRSGGAR